MSGPCCCRAPCQLLRIVNIILEQFGHVSNICLTGPQRMHIMQAIIKVYMQWYCNMSCLFTWCLMTNQRRRSSCATAASHDVPRQSPDLDLPEAQMRSIARLRACDVPPDRSSIQKKAVTRQLPCFSTLDTDEASHSESGSASAAAWSSSCCTWVLGSTRCSDACLA